ncbi:hypothetical protein AMATHDRAFT_141977 [Amanita thiersii Skay4041]|uniref:Palmitoyltransferase n=1 Tax=Amanita thiersii Skay4041 TaxID=703135 RepID=A0A2A9NVJ9_9AGAR|nr:hypothetical protein AMATHDRAFT_141977 [Amanita thiersii Skay4041]
MSSSPLSSNFSQIPFQPRRNSQASQLPLPTSMNPQSPPRLQGASPSLINNAGSKPEPSSSNTTTPTTPQHPRIASILASRTLGASVSPPSSPNMSSFPHMGSPHARSTHAGGIQPSVSFFRPSRPTYQVNYSHPSSVASSEDDIPEHSHEPDIYPLTPLHSLQIPEKNEPRKSDSASDEGGAMEEDHSESVAGVKQSREPLLPISGRPGGFGSRSAASAASRRMHVPAESGLSKLTPGQQDGGKRLSAGKLVRNSLDRVFSLGRGMSIDSIRRSAATEGGHVSVDEQAPTTERKFTNEGEAGGFRSSAHIHRRSSTSPSRHKRTSSSVGHHAQLQGVTKRNSLSVSVSRHTPIASPSPDPSFISRPPETSPSSPPLSAVPVKNSKTGRVIRRYEVHPSRNRFFLRGHLLTGGDSPWAFIACFSLALGLTGVWFGTTCVWWWRNESPAVAIIGAYLALIVISSMLATAFSDPGILPRDLDPDPPYPADGEMRVPLPRDLRVRNDSVRVKYCPTCKTYRPPRASHCKMCDNCVDGCDHHCQWVNNCVGRRNYTTFIVLLMSAVLTLVLVICTSALHLYLLTRTEHVKFRQALGRAPGSAVAFGMAICIIWPVAALLSYHVRLLVLNTTTIEQASISPLITIQAHKSIVPGPAPPNPFNHGDWRRNLAEALCRARGYTWLEAPAIVTEDKRKVNPGMYDNWDSGSGVGIVHSQTPR